MHRIILAGALSCVLAGCVQTTTRAPLQPGTPIVIRTSEMPAIVRQAQARVVQACGFQPAARMVTAVIRSFKPETTYYAGLLDQIVQGVCDAASGGTYASYRGVPVEGRWVR